MTPRARSCARPSAPPARSGAALFFALTALTAAAIALAGCAQEPGSQAPDAPAAATLPIVGGTPGGDRAVVAVTTNFGGLCSGTLITPRVVLTAKHCVQGSGQEAPYPPRNFTVTVGDSARRPEQVFGVLSVRTTPGVWREGGATGLSGAIVGVDVAVLVLDSGPSDIEPIPVRREPPDDLIGQTITAIGYGQTPSGDVANKYTAMGRVTGISGNVIYVGSLICQGDSGGPMVTGDREVAGVVSFGNGSCGSGIGGYNAIYSFLSMIDEAVAESGACLDNGDEVCDGYDNDCDDLTDEGCLPEGSACTEAGTCAGRIDCEETSRGRLCAAPCDPMRPSFGCDPGFYCARAADPCTGFCLPVEGALGELPNESACASDSECASLHCTDPGDGRMRCLSPCRGDEGMCLTGQACAAAPGACNACVAESIVIGSRGLGESCEADTECGSSRCLTDGDRSYCTRACTGDEGCPGGFHCRDAVCVAGDRGSLGEGCLSNGDCHEGLFCAFQGDRSWCSRFCFDQPCDSGFACVSVGTAELCAPESGVIGDACSGDGDCLSGVCRIEAGAREGACTRRCGTDSACAAPFECRIEPGESEGHCLAPEAAPTSPPSSGGCAVEAEGPARAPWSAGWAAALIFGLLGLRRSRRARRG